MPVKTFRFGALRPDAGPYFNVGDSGSINLLEIRGAIKVHGGYAVQPFWYNNLSDYAVSDFRSGLFAYTVPNSSVWENAFLLASNTAIRQISHSGATDTDVTRGGGAYTNTQSEYNWQFAVYGDRVIATNGIDAIQSKLLASTSVFAKNNVITSPVTADPRANFVATFKDHVFIADIDLTVGTSAGESYGGAYGSLAAQRHPNLYWWSATDNALRFSDPNTTPSIIGSDFRVCNDGLGPIIGMKAATDYLLLCRTGGISIVTGPPFVRENIETTVGRIFPNSMVRVNNDIYAMTKVGPVVIEDGKNVRRLAQNKISRWLMQTKNILFDDTNSNHRRQIYGARNITGDYIYWCIKEFVDDTGIYYDKMLAYSVDEDEFTITNSAHIISSTYQANEVSLITSFNNPYVDSYDYGDGVAGFGSITTHLGNFNSLITLTRDAAVGTGFNTIASLRTTFIGIGDANGVYQVWKPKRIRPIYSVDRYDSSINTVPSGAYNVFSDLVSHVHIFPRNRYSGADFDYNSTGDTVVPNTFLTLSKASGDGWFNAESIPAAHFHSIQFNMMGANMLNVFQFVGFDMEFELIGNTGTGMEAVY